MEFDLKTQQYHPRHARTKKILNTMKITAESQRKGFYKKDY